jgi:ATP-dependent helicase/DNAse subunit B
VAILTPRFEVYRPLIQAVASEYEIVIDEQANLDDNPAVSVLINLLELAPDFPWRQTFNALRSPYIKQPYLSGEQLNTLEQLTRERPVVSGLGQWNYALKPLELSEKNPYAYEIQKRLLVASLPQEDLEAIDSGLKAFFKHISPKKRKSYSEHTAWLQEVVLGIGLDSSIDESDAEGDSFSFNMLDCCLEGKFKRRDRAALAEVLSILQQLITAADMVPAGTGKKAPWDIFRRDLIEAIRRSKVPKDPGTQAIHFSDLNAARSMSIDYLFVLGLAEGEFPRGPKADPFYSKIERAAANLPLRLVDPSEDASLWWQAISNTRRSLTIIRPWLDENGVPWLPSPYWRAVIDQLPGIAETILPMESLPKISEAASSAELLLALADNQADVVPAEVEGQWLGIKRAQGVIAQRSSWRPLGVYEGVLASGDLLKELSQKYGSGHTWSASRLNRYGNCPYGFFAEQILHFGAKAEPEEGFDAMQRGSLIHAVLETLYLQLMSEDLPPTLPNQSAVLDILEEVCDQIFSWAPQRYGFRPGPLWDYEQQELGRILRAFIRWECEENQERADYNPRYLELFFGFSKSSHGILDFEDADGLKIKVHGVIDRVDVNGEGFAAVIDYKSGGGQFSKSDISRGLAFQTPLYALAVDQLFSEISAVSVSKYLLVPARKESGVLKFSGPVSEDETVQTAINQAGAFVHNVRHGFFPSAPGKPTAGIGADGGACRSHCDFAPLCRVTRMSIAKVKYL